MFCFETDSTINHQTVHCLFSIKTYIQIYKENPIERDVDEVAAEAFRIMREKIIQEESISAVAGRANADLEASLFLVSSEANAYRAECQELFAHRELFGDAVQQELVRTAETAASLSVKLAGEEVARAEARSYCQPEAHTVFVTRSRLEQEEKASRLRPKPGDDGGAVGEETLRAYCCRSLRALRAREGSSGCRTGALHLVARQGG